MDRHITAISDPPEFKAFKIVFTEESKVFGFTYTLSYGTDAEKWIEEIERSDIIFISSLDISESVKDAILSSQAQFIVSFSGQENLERGKQAFLEKAKEYFERGGIQNIDGLIKLSLWVCGENINFPDVLEIPWHGLVHPRVGIFAQLSEYSKYYPFSSFPLVGLVFDRKNWLYGQADDVFELVKDLESKRIGVLPVFMQSKDLPLDLLNTPNLNVIVNFGIADKKQVLELGLPVLDYATDVKLYHPDFPGFSEKLTLDNECIAQSIVRWINFSTKSKGERVVAFYPEIPKDFEKLNKLQERNCKIVEFSEVDNNFDIVVDLSNDLNLMGDYIYLTPD